MTRQEIQHDIDRALLAQADLTGGQGLDHYYEMVLVLGPLALLGLEVQGLQRVQAQAKDPAVMAAVAQMSPEPAPINENDLL